MLAREIFERHPDYLFARTALAQLAIKDGRLEAAQALLEPLLSRPRFHFSEFAALSDAQTNLHLRSGNLEAAKACLDLWARADPDHPGVASARSRLNSRGRPRLPGLRR